MAAPGYPRLPYLALQGLRTVYSLSPPGYTVETCAPGPFTLTLSWANRCYPWRDDAQVLYIARAPDPPVHYRVGWGYHLRSDGYVLQDWMRVGDKCYWWVARHLLS